MSSSSDFFPYPVREGNGVAALELVSSDPEFTCKAGLADMSHAALGESVLWRVRLKVSLEALAEVLPPGEITSPPVRALVLLDGVPARLRAAVELLPAAYMGVFEAEWLLALDSGFGEVTATPVVIRATDGSDPGYACHPGAVLLRGDAITIRFDAGPKPLGDTLDVRFVNFADDPALKSVADQMYAVDFESVPPVLLLNSGVDDLKRVLTTGARRGGDARVRNMLYPAIAAQVWSALAGVAFSNLHGALNDQGNAGAVDSEAGSMAIEEITEWEQSVVRFLAPRMYGVPTDHALESLALSLVSGAMPDIQSRLLRAVQDWVALNEGYRNLIVLRDGTGV